jgi:hypothetical protein
MLVSTAAQHFRYPSYNRWYWGLWCFCVAALVILSGGVPEESQLGVFALITGFGAVYVFCFEFGRFEGFAQRHFPDRWQRLSRGWAFEIFAFFHPRLWRELFASPDELPTGYVDGRDVFRTAFLFSWIALSFLLILTWVQ